MSDRWKVMIEPPDGESGPVPLVEYGPAGDKMPARFSAVIEYAGRPLRMRVSASFDGVNRVRAEIVSVRRTDGGSVTPEDMASLQLAAVMGSVVWAATNHGRGVVFQGGRNPKNVDKPPTDEELLILARMYWFEFVSWGKPRQVVMAAFDLPRSTANYWIRKARDRYGLPGVHAAESGD